jgi:calcium permeable stress-gated cation channel
MIIVSAVFVLFWIAYRHNYYYVQVNKVDTHGLLFNNAISQLFAGLYVSQITLIGLFFIVVDSDNHLACVPQAAVMITAIILTAAFHYVLEQSLSPLYELLPVTLEDKAADAERARFRISSDGPPEDVQKTVEGERIEQRTSAETPREEETVAQSSSRAPMAKEQPTAEGTAAYARKTLGRLNNRIEKRLTYYQDRAPHRSSTSRRLDVANQLADAIARYPDELIDLSPQERDAELKAAYQDPVTREPSPVVWIPQDPAGISEDMIKHSKNYGRYLQYSNAGAYLTEKNKCEVTQPAPDVRPDWLLEWVL